MPSCSIDAELSFVCPDMGRARAGIRDVRVGDLVGDTRLASRLADSRRCRNRPEAAAACARPSETEAGAVDTFVTRRCSNTSIVSLKLPSRRSGECPRRDRVATVVGLRKPRARGSLPARSGGVPCLPRSSALPGRGMRLPPEPTRVSLVATARASSTSPSGSCFCCSGERDLDRVRPNPAGARPSVWPLASRDNRAWRFARNCSVRSCACARGVVPRAVLSAVPSLECRESLNWL